MINIKICVAHLIYHTIHTKSIIFQKIFVSSVDSLDWKELTEEEMKTRIFEKVKPGSILLFHNGTKQTADALPGILTALKTEGYSFVKVSDLIYKENYTIDHTGRQHKTDN